MWEEAIQALILGILQGLTEFLPISSSGHLLLLPWLAGWQPMGLAFDVMLHLGTLAAVLVHFRQDWKQVALQALKRDFTFKRSPAAGEAPRLELLAAATLPAVVVGGLLAGSIEQFRGPLVVVVNLIVFGLLMGGADWAGDRQRGLQDVGFRDALWIGLAQALALMPGVSRSGVTITAALLLGFRRQDSARFSFLMAAPVITLAGAKSLFDLWMGSGESGLHAVPLVIGMLTAAVSGWLCIRFFLNFLRTRSLLPFVVYRIMLALVVLAIWRAGG